MPRAPRHVPPHCLVHIRCRFVDGRFLLDAASRREYLRRLDEALRRCDWGLLSYALMSTHVHLALVSGLQELDRWIRSFHVGYAQWVNRCLRESNPKALGHVFADRPSSNLLELRSAGVLVAYHHNNPVRAGLVTSAKESDWTSHRSYLGLEEPIPSLDVRRGLQLSGYGDPIAFDEFVRARHRITSRGRSAEGIIARAARLMRASLEAVLRGARTPKAVDARRAALIAWTGMGRQQAPMARALRVSRSTASRLTSDPTPRALEVASQITAELEELL